MPETLLMCTPEGFAVNYEINPWMQNQIGHVLPERAVAQWRGLFDTLSALADVKLMHGDPAWPDLVFTANAGLPLAREKKFILSNFKCPQRRGEKAIDRAWFEHAGWTCIDLPDSAVFEGAGDALFDSVRRLWVGGGPRSDTTTPEHLARHIVTPIHRLELVDPRFYHLDTCFCPLPAGYSLYLPEAFDGASRNLLASSFGDKLISLTPEEGQQFCANAVCAGRVIVMNQATPRLKKLLDGLGFSVLETPLSEFMKSGGSAKCLTLSLGGWANG
ncbi:MAG TPA: arginine deiminase-related protein [Gallionellaceae bacterium]|nr:arginine deiminase-related protein [Gallionellaceae bacterium]